MELQLTLCNIPRDYTMITSLDRIKSSTDQTFPSWNNLNWTLSSMSIQTWFMMNFWALFKLHIWQGTYLCVWKFSLHMLGLDVTQTLSEKPRKAVMRLNFIITTRCNYGKICRGEKRESFFTCHWPQSKSWKLMLTLKHKENGFYTIVLDSCTYCKSFW